MSIRLASHLAAALVALLASFAPLAQPPLQVPGERAAAAKTAPPPKLRLSPAADRTSGMGSIWP